MTPLQALLYRIGQEQIANDRNAVDGFSCGHEEAELLWHLHRNGWIFLPRHQPLQDGALFSRVALTEDGVREWMRLHQERGSPSGS